MSTKIVPLMDMKELEKVGVQLLKAMAKAQWFLRCNSCGATWPVPDTDIPQNIWHCPNKCNWEG